MIASPSHFSQAHFPQAHFPQAHFPQTAFRFERPMPDPVGPATRLGNRLRIRRLPLREAAIPPVRIAHRRQDLLSAFKLVYSAYLTTGLVRPNRYEMRATPYHLLSTTDVIISTAPSPDRVVCTLSLVGDGELGLPIESAFPAEVAHLRRQGRSLGEVTSLADLREVESTGMSPLLKAMGLMAQRARYRGIEDLLITVHPHHVQFYKRFIGFEQIGDTRPYGSVLDNPAVPLLLDLTALSVNHPRAYQRFFGEPFPAELLVDHPLPVLLRAELARLVTACERLKPRSEALVKVA
jgi:hypothetical protein